MFFARKRFAAPLLAFCMACAGYAHSAGEVPETKLKMPSAKEYRLILPTNRLEQDSRLSEEKRRKRIVERANTVFTLLGGETALQKGDAGTALATYMVMLDRQKNPEIAERALEMAVSLNAFEYADMIYRKWQQIEPVPGEAQKRMAWVRSLLSGDTEYTLKNFDGVLNNADETQARRLFLLLAQASVRQPGLSEKITGQVHKAAKKYPDMPEAAIADAIFSAHGNHEKHAVEALQRLAKLDSELLPPTELTLRLIAHRNPKIISRFFEKTDTKNLSPIWQELEISSLITAKDYGKAYSRLQQMLSENPSADLYMQAALLAGIRKDDVSVFGNYVEKAYNAGTREQKSRAAIIATMRYADDKDYQSAKKWLDRINASDYAFDKAVLSASLYADRGNYAAALKEAQKGQKLPEQQGRFFNSGDLQRILIYALSRSNRPKEALAELNKLSAKVEKQRGSTEQLSDILYHRAMIYADGMNQPAKAIPDLRRYLQLNPNSSTGMNALGYTLLTMDKKHFDEAFALIQAAYQIEPDSPAINDSLGWAYYLKGDAQAARPYLQFAFEQYPDPEVAAHYGEVLWQLGEKQQAQEVWKKGLERGGKNQVIRQTVRRLGAKLPAATPAAKRKN